MATNQQVIDRARRHIPDAAKRRVSDATYLEYLKDFLLWLYNNRPDFFIGSYTSIPTLAAIGDNYPLDDRTIPMAELYLTFRADYPDDVNAATERVTQHFNLLSKEAMGG